MFGLGGGFLLFAGAPPLPPPELLAPFSTLCSVNVALIGLWKGDERSVPVGTFRLAGVCLLAAALSALLLGLLAKRFRPATRHALADAALLTPLLFLGWA